MAHKIEIDAVKVFGGAEGTQSQPFSTLTNPKTCYDSTIYYDDSKGKETGRCTTYTCPYSDTSNYNNFNIY